MSTSETNVMGQQHVFQKLEKTSKALTGQRLARVISKSSKTSPKPANLPESLCMSVPPILDSEIADNLKALYPHIGKMVQDAQDGIIRNLRISTGCSSINQEQIAMPAVLVWLENENAGRTTKESLEEWFTETYSDVAAEFICGANKWEAEQMSEEQTAKVVEGVKKLADWFSGFSSGKYDPDMGKCKTMLKFVGFAEPIADERLQSFGEKADAIYKRKQEELSSDSLGL